MYWSQVRILAGPPKNMENFEFTNNWFKDAAKFQWDRLIPKLKPSKVLEIGSYEGASACYLIQKLGREKSIEIHCIDSWSSENNPDKLDNENDNKFKEKYGNLSGELQNMKNVESRFKKNTKIAIESVSNKINLFIHKGFSDDQLIKLLNDGKKNYFDFIYVDGSHLGPDVLCDAVLSFRLLKIGGVMAFDDYLFSQGGNKDLTLIPKLAIDSFVNLYSGKISMLNFPTYQIYVKKISN